MYRHQKFLHVAVFVFIFSFFLLQVFGQNVPPKEDLKNPFTIAGSYLKQNNYITPIFELKALEEKYLASPMWKSTYLEMMILLQGQVGNYDEAYRYEDMLYADFPTSKRIREMYVKDITESPLANYKMLDALDAIENVAGGQQVVMINEEHRTPFHRAMTLQLLSRLYAKGFRYFAVETLYDSDTDLGKRKFPTQGTGFYTADPVFADAIRTALKLGYKLVPYESMDMNCKSPEDNPEFCNDKREREQAQNLYDRILKNNPQAKIFVHVGRGHNSKAEGDKTFNFMAYYFKNISKIDPFTIDQLRFSERRDTGYEQPLYRFLTKNNFLQKPVVYQAPDNKFYTLGFGYDMVMFHPRMRYENGRATFLQMNGLRHSEKIDLKKLKLHSDKKLFAENESVLIQAFYAEESADAVPVDQIILYPKKEVSVLMLPQGKFRIRAMDKAGKVIGQYERTVN